mgnify:CR=1 FL=1
MLQLLKLLSTSTKPLNYTEIRRATPQFSSDLLERAHAEKLLVWTGDYAPSTYTITEAGRIRLAELEAEERVLEALKDGFLNFPTFFARLGDSNAVGAAADRLEKAGKVVIERSCNGTISGLRLATSEALANSATVEEARTAGVYVDVSDSPLEEVRALLGRVADLEGDCGMLQEDLEEANKELAAEKARNEALEERLRTTEGEVSALKARNDKLDLDLLTATRRIEILKKDNSVLLHHEKCRPHAKLLAVEAARDGRTMLLKIEAAKLKIQIGDQIWIDEIGRAHV